MQDKFESIRQQRSKHLLDCRRRCCSRSLRDHIELVAFKPDGPSLHSAGVHAVSRGDQIQHSGLVQYKPVITKEIPIHVWPPAISACMDIRGFECGWLVVGCVMGCVVRLCDDWAGENDEENHTRGRSYHHSTLHQK